MSECIVQLLTLLVVSTAIAVALVGWASGILEIGTVDGSISAVVVGLCLFVLSGLIAVVFEPLEIEDESA
ncbi:hypothetical protein CP556_15835 [Natrinema sp. CBA1119]|uniref:hypothetical protein n=1 Tax=Natrinema sp. CBA1119 TaxID=1608465 RepID=UPI000BF38C50|nr:hypothetical protein [Natrinema sp. CBA1119]PGF17424.1 hypothetical protein CP556_15835 [Natrinema sp. CBA1119]